MKSFDLNTCVREHNQYQKYAAIGFAMAATFLWWLSFWLIYGVFWTLMFFSDPQGADGNGTTLSVIAWIACAALVGEAVRDFRSRQATAAATKDYLDQGERSGVPQEAVEQYLDQQNFQAGANPLQTALMVAFAAPRFTVMAILGFRSKLPSNPEYWNETRSVFEQIGQHQGWLEVDRVSNKAEHLWNLIQLDLLEVRFQDEGEVRLPSPIIAEYFTL